MGRLHGFFSTVQSWYVNKSAEESDNTQKIKSAENHGRYIQLILWELARQEPRILSQFFHGLWGGDFDKRKAYQLKREWHFRGKRFADLALFQTGCEKPFALIEIKYNDNFIKAANDKELDQLREYVEHCRAEGIRFLALTRHHPDETQMSLIKSVDGKHKLFAEIGPYLKSAKNSSIAHMTLEYFKELGLVMENIDQNMLYGFFSRILNPFGGSGKILSQGMLDEGPTNFSSLINNMTLMAEFITPRVRHPLTEKTRNRSATVDFEIRPKVVGTKQKILDLANQAGRSRKVEMNYRYDFEKAGGKIRVFAQNSLGNEIDYLYIKYGFEFVIQPNKEQKMTVYQFAWLVGRHITNSYDNDAPTWEQKEITEKNALNDLDALNGNFIELIKNALRNGNKNVVAGEHGHQEIIRRIEKSLIK